MRLRPVLALRDCASGRLPGWLALVLLGSAGGCADAKGRFQEFEARRIATEANRAGASADAAGGAGGADSCRPPAPGVVHGQALLALQTDAAEAAILFFGDIKTPNLRGATAVEYDYHALDAGDRHTQVGDPLVVGPYAIGEDGRFDAETALSTLPGSANAILPGVPITSQLTLHGTICGASEFYCGTVTGTVTAPIQGPTTGQFGLLLVSSIDDLPQRPRFGCAEDALAPPLD